MTKRQVPSEAEVYRRLREVWHYDPDTGIWTRLQKNAQGPGAYDHGFVSGHGYRTCQMDNIAYPASRLAWLYMTAKWPEREVRYRNRDRLDLRWSNLYLRKSKSGTKESLTLERLKEVMDYSPESGVFTWKVSSPRAREGSEAGVVTDTGYRLMSVDGQRFLAHRLAMFYVEGKWPEHQVDHINGKRADNRLSNLRHATPSQNAANAAMRSTNRTGLKGVSPAKGGKWLAQIVVDYKIMPLGNFNTPVEAHAAYCEAAAKYFGDFAHDGSARNEPPDETEG